MAGINDGKLRYLKRSNLNPEQQIYKGYFREIIHSYGIDTSYYRHDSQFYNEPSGVFLNDYTYGEDTTMSYWLSADVVVFMEMLGDSMLMSKFGFETDGDAAVYMLIDDFTEGFRDEVGAPKFDTICLPLSAEIVSGKGDLFGDIVNCDLSGFCSETLCLTGITGFVSGDMQCGFNRYPVPYNEYIKSPQFYKNRVVQGGVDGTWSGFLDASGNGFISGYAEGDIFYYVPPARNAGPNWAIAPQVGDFFRLEFDELNREEYEITKVYDRNLQVDGINPLLSRYVWHMDVVRRDPSHETVIGEAIGNPVEENFTPDHQRLSDFVEIESDETWDYNTQDMDNVDKRGDDNVYGGYGDSNFDDYKPSGDKFFVHEPNQSCSSCSSHSSSSSSASSASSSLSSASSQSSSSSSVSSDSSQSSSSQVCGTWSSSSNSSASSSDSSASSSRSSVSSSSSNSSSSSSSATNWSSSSRSSSRSSESSSRSSESSESSRSSSSTVCWSSSSSNSSVSSQSSSSSSVSSSSSDSSSSSSQSSLSSVSSSSTTNWSSSSRSSSQSSISSSQSSDSSVSSRSSSSQDCGVWSSSSSQSSDSSVSSSSSSVSSSSSLSSSSSSISSVSSVSSSSTTNWSSSSNSSSRSSESSASSSSSSDSSSSSSFNPCSSSSSSVSSSSSSLSSVSSRSSSSSSSTTNWSSSSNSSSVSSQSSSSSSISSVSSASSSLASCSSSSSSSISSSISSLSSVSSDSSSSSSSTTNWSSSSNSSSVSSVSSSSSSISSLSSSSKTRCSSFSSSVSSSSMSSSSSSSSVSSSSSSSISSSSSSISSESSSSSRRRLYRYVACRIFQYETCESQGISSSMSSSSISSESSISSSVSSLSSLSSDSSSSISSSKSSLCYSSSSVSSSSSSVSSSSSSESSSSVSSSSSSISSSSVSSSSVSSSSISSSSVSSDSASSESSSSLSSSSISSSSESTSSDSSSSESSSSDSSSSISSSSISSSSTPSSSSSDSSVSSSSTNFNHHYTLCSEESSSSLSSSSISNTSSSSSNSSSLSSNSSSLSSESSDSSSSSSESSDSSSSSSDSSASSSDSSASSSSSSESSNSSNILDMSAIYLTPDCTTQGGDAVSARVGFLTTDTGDFPDINFSLVGGASDADNYRSEIQNGNELVQFTDGPVESLLNVRVRATNPNSGNHIDEAEIARPGDPITALGQIGVNPNTFLWKREQGDVTEPTVNNATEHETFIDARLLAMQDDANYDTIADNSSVSTWRMRDGSSYSITLTQEENRFSRLIYTFDGLLGLDTPEMVIQSHRGSLTVCYTTIDPMDQVSGMRSWTSVGNTVGDDSGEETVDVSSVPDNAWIGVLAKADYDNDASQVLATGEFAFSYNSGAIVFTIRGNFDIVPDEVLTTISIGANTAEAYTKIQNDTLPFTYLQMIASNNRMGFITTNATSTRRCFTRCDFTGATNVSIAFTASIAFLNELDLVIVESILDPVCKNNWQRLGTVLANIEHSTARIMTTGNSIRMYDISNVTKGDVWIGVITQDDFDNVNPSVIPLGISELKGFSIN